MTNLADDPVLSHSTQPGSTQPHLTEPHLTEPHSTEPHSTEPHSTQPGHLDVVVQIRDLHKTYGLVRAVDGLNLDVHRGSILGLVGPNGAGKTTTMAIVATLLRPTSGQVTVFGINPSDDPIGVRRNVGYMPDIVGVYEKLQVDEYLHFFAHATGVPKSERRALIDGLLELVDLGDKRTEMVDSLSRGMKQRLSLARSLVHDPQLLILDEPASGLDPRARVDLRVLLQALQGMGKTIIVSSHILAELQEMCSEVAIVANGKVAAAGTIADISQNLAGGRKIEVGFADGTNESFTVPDIAEQENLLRRLMFTDQRRVIEFRSTDTGLEDLFLRYTDLDSTGTAPSPAADGPIPFDPSSTTSGLEQPNV